MDDVAIGPAVVGIVVLTSVMGEVDVAGAVAGNDGAGLVAQVVVERRREVERTDLREGILFYILSGNSASLFCFCLDVVSALLLLLFDRFA